jgi:lysophospholipase L1-like esterase
MAQKIRIENPVHFLALGDSYTIGQSVSIYDRWPNQLAAELTNRGYNVADVKFIAQTGWRTDNLKTAIDQQQPLTGFNLVSLLIGVNNQFQGGNTSTYYTQFENLLKTAILLASNKPEHVFVLSIPDYAFTPYGGGSSIISNQIDQFNSINKVLSENYKVKYVDITPISRLGMLKPELVASDGLHPSGIMYGLWVQEILKSIEKELGIFDEPASDEGLSYSVSQRQLTVKSAKQGGSLYICNSSGQRVLRGLISENTEATLNLGMFAAGLYILIIENEEKIIYRARFILL